MQSTRRTLLISCLLALAAATPAGAAWTRIGGVINADGNATASATALAAVDGIAHMAWSEGTSTQVRVARWDPGTGTWVHLGTGTNPVFPASATSDQAALIAHEGAPWVAVEDVASGPSPALARVARWNGQAWEPVGGALNVSSGVSAERPVLAAAPSGTFAAWAENGALHARRFEGVGWGPASEDLRLGAGTVADTSMAVVDGVPHLAWIENDAGAFRIFARRFNGTAWESVTSGATPVNTRTAQVDDIALAGLGGDAHLIYGQGADGVFVARLENGAWTPVGQALNVLGQTSATSVSLSPHGSTLLAAWSESEGASAQVRVKRLVPGSATWTEVPAAGSPNPVNTSSTSTARTVAIASVAGAPYVTWAEAPTGSAGSVARAARLDPSFGAPETPADLTPTSAVVRANVDVFGVEFPLVARFGELGAFDKVTAPVVFSAPVPSQVGFTLQGLEPATTYTWRTEVSDGSRTSVSAAREGTFTTPAAPAPTPAALPPLPEPELRKAAVGAVVSGTVLVKLPGTRRFVRLGSGPVRLPIGTQVDARKGRIALTFERPGNLVQTATFFAGRFRIASQRADGLARIALQGAVGRCPKARGAVLGSAAAKRRKRRRPLRRLWGDGAGRFQTSGKYAAAVVRGTKWLTEDFCDATRIRVRRGRVDARDLVRRRIVRLRAGRSYTARARR